LIISNFPVPNNKEDLIEFISLAVGNSRDMSAEEKNSYITIKAFSVTKNPELIFRESEIKAWQSKAEAAIMKAKILFIDNLILLEHLKKFEEQFIVNKSWAQQAEKKRQKYGLILLILFMIFMIISYRLMVNH
jgi:hypothetical protein